MLCTKGISSLLSLAWIQIFKFWITYPLAAVRRFVPIPQNINGLLILLTYTFQILLATGIGQIRYLNRALMKFDSKVVIPTQFVLFNFAAIVGSAVLYRDFDKVPFEHMVIFLYGCAATFLGVFILTLPTPQTNNEDDEEGTIRGDGEDDLLSETGVNGGPDSIPRRSSFTFSPAHNQSLPFPASTPVQAGPSTGSLRTTIRPRSSSSAIGLSPAGYLLLATEHRSTNPATPLPIIAMPILRQHSTPTPQRHGSYQAAPRLAPSRSRGTSRSRSHDRGGGNGGAESYNSDSGLTRMRVQSVE